jgi:ABC-2 type transport system permease protein
MKILAIAGKDLRRLIGSPSFLTFGFIIPLLMGALFYLAFGGLGSQDQGLHVAATKVQVVNLDRQTTPGGGMSAGQLMIAVLSSPDLTGLLQVSIAPDPASARAAVDRQEAGVAVVIPADLTDAASESGDKATIELYSDPTLTLGPRIVQSIVQSLVDSYSGRRIAFNVAAEQLGRRGVTLDTSKQEALALEYAEWAANLGEGGQGGDSLLLDVQAPAAAGVPAPDLRRTIVSSIMAGMMVFYVFYSGASSAETLLAEEERGTLARIFSTPTPVRDVLVGRILATYVMEIVQVLVLLVSSALIFGVRWGRALPVGLMALGMIVLAASFGLFLTSLLRSTRQGGLIYGGLMTILGMVGMIGIFGLTSANAPRAAMEIASLFTPQGWAVKGWLLLLDGAGTIDVFPTVGVMLLLGAVFFALGLLRFRKRFA